MLGFTHVGPGANDADELYAIHVHPRAEGLGLGAQLLTASAEALRLLGHLKALLWVLEGNRPGRHDGTPHLQGGWLIIPGAARTIAITGTLGGRHVAATAPSN